MRWYYRDLGRVTFSSNTDVRGLSVIGASLDCRSYGRRFPECTICNYFVKTKVPAILMDFSFARLNVTLSVRFMPTFLGIVSLLRGCMTTEPS